MCWVVFIVVLVLGLVNSVVVVIYTGVYVFVRCYSLFDCRLMVALMCVIDLLWFICGLFLVMVWLCWLVRMWCLCGCLCVCYLA